jgi:CheY-like chemotaxis protein
MAQTGPKEYLVLVVDDEAIMRETSKDVLESIKGVRCILAADAEEAKRAFEEHDIDAVVTDLNMPGESGLTVTRDVRDSGSTVPIIIFSGSLVAGEELRAQDAGANLVLPKPSGIPLLRKAVRDYLGIKE